MPINRRAEIKDKRRLLDHLFKVDQYSVSYELFPYTQSRDEQQLHTSQRMMSGYVTQLNFESGDAFAILLFNVHTNSVRLVEQFKLPVLLARRRDDPTNQDGWIVEVLAGMVRADQRPDARLRFEMLEHGYVIEQPELICKFLSCPGGISERIFLFSAKITNGNDLRSEFSDGNIRSFEVGVNDLFDQLENGKIEDPKLIIAAYWLRERLGRRAGTVYFFVLWLVGMVAMVLDAFMWRGGRAAAFALGIFASLVMSQVWQKWLSRLKRQYHVG
jgi:hypothetical protein